MEIFVIVGIVVLWMICLGICIEFVDNFNFSGFLLLFIFAPFMAFIILGVAIAKKIQ